MKETQGNRRTMLVFYFMFTVLEVVSHCNLGLIQAGCNGNGFANIDPHLLPCVECHTLRHS